MKRVLLSLAVLSLLGFSVRSMAQGGPSSDPGDLVVGTGPGALAPDDFDAIDCIVTGGVECPGVSTPTTEAEPQSVPCGSPGALPSPFCAGTGGTGGGTSTDDTSTDD